MTVKIYTNDLREDPKLDAISSAMHYAPETTGRINRIDPWNETIMSSVKDPFGSIAISATLKVIRKAFDDFEEYQDVVNTISYFEILHIHNKYVATPRGKLIGLAEIMPSIVNPTE